MESEFIKLGISYLHTLSKGELVDFYKQCNSNYYNNVSECILTDDQYDILHDYVQQKYPTLIEIGSSVEKKKVKLPFFMPSMNKLKNDEKQLENWKQRFHGDYIISTKLDGVSALFDSRNGEQKLYSRGNGSEGSNISHLISYLSCKDCKDIVVRGELILPKSTNLSKLRNVVSGLVNTKNIQKEKMKDVHFVVYELIHPPMIPSLQCSFLKENYPTLQTVEHFVTKTINTSILSNQLIEWRKNCPYEIDGIICSNNTIMERKNENPSNAFAFKMILTEQMIEAVVMDVLWNVSKDGYLIPKVKFEPVEINGIRIEYATAFHAKFVMENGIGVGTRVELVRSGDVIPHILKVISPTEPKMPENYNYTWTKNNINIVLKDKETSSDFKKKEVVYFFEGLTIDGFGKKTIEKVFDSGYDTIPKILQMDTNDFLTIEGIQEVLANKIIKNKKETLNSISLETIFSYSNILERGFGEKKIKYILSNIPDWNSLNSDVLKKKICLLKGFTEMTANIFASKRDSLLSFLVDTKLDEKLKNLIVKNGGKLSGKSIVLSGFRDKDIEQQIESEGGIITSSISKNTFCLIMKEDGKETTKTKKAKELGVRIFLKENINYIL
jgi:NAD-dependent DNA ligase